MDATVMNTSEQLATFAACVFDPSDIVEVRAWRGEDITCRWCPANELADNAAELVNDNEVGWHIYVGANPRRAAGLKGDKSIDLARCLFIDDDDTEPADTIKRLEAARLPRPTLIVATGHGTHVYWRLAESIDPATFRKCQKHLIALLHTDKSIHNPERIMRLPGLRNWKEPVAQCSIIEAIPTNIIKIDDLIVTGKLAVDITDLLPTDNVPIMRGPESRPGDEYNQRGDVKALLLAHGWVLVKDGDNQHWRRPGKDIGTSATLKDGVFYVFSSNAEPFVANKGHSPFAVYTLLEHNGDFTTASATLRSQGYGQEMVSRSAVNAVDLDYLLGIKQESPKDPGPIPDRLLFIPGFISKVVDYTMMTAPYPNHVLAFAGALALQSFLAGRKVRDISDTRSNLYILALANSGTGKDHPRKVNQKILDACGETRCLGDTFASGEGIADRMALTHAALFQTDEIDGLINSISRAKDARHDGIMEVLMKMYTSANSIFPMRSRAGRADDKPINQPSLTLYGSSTPHNFYESLSHKMLENGFFSRLLIVEVGRRGRGQLPKVLPVPQDIVDVAQWWSSKKDEHGNLNYENPTQSEVPYTEAALKCMTEFREHTEDQYDKAYDANNAAAMAIWTRATEKALKLALLYAVSEDHQTPVVDKAAIEWGCYFVLHQTHRMLFMASSHVAETPFHADCLRVIEKLRAAPGRELSHSILLRKMRMDSKVFAALMDTMIQQGDIEVISEPTSGRPTRIYHLL